jgi:hypothetical protein
MRRAPAWIVVVGVVALWTGLPGHARADAELGFWVTLAAGAAGASSPSSYSEFWFESPHAPPIAVTKLTGTGNFSTTASTAGGNTFFNGDGTPVLLPTTDGFATLTNREVANGSGALPRFAGGTQASGAPQAGATIPSDAKLLSASFSDPAANGSQVLTIGLTDQGGKSLGGGHVTLPGGGWWVVGLGPGTKDGSGSNPGGGGDGGGTGGTGGSGGGSSGGGKPDPGPPHTGGGGGSVATPEPTSVVLIGAGGLTVAGWRRLRRK